MDSNFWICSDKEQMGPGRQCNPRKYLDGKTWDVWGYDIETCLSEPKQSMCKVQFSLAIMVVVIVFNVIKLSCMVYALVNFDAKHLLATTGDAAISFMKEKDSTTAGPGREVMRTCDVEVSCWTDTKREISLSLVPLDSSLSSRASMMMKVLRRSRMMSLSSSMISSRKGSSPAECPLCLLSYTR